MTFSPHLTVKSIESMLTSSIRNTHVCYRPTTIGHTISRTRGPCQSGARLLLYCIDAIPVPRQKMQMRQPSLYRLTFGLVTQQFNESMAIIVIPRTLALTLSA